MVSVRKVLFFSLSFSLFFAITLSAESFPTVVERPTYGKQDIKIHKIIITGIEEFYQGNFQKSLAFFKKIEAYPEFRYVSYYYQGVTLGKIMYYYHTNEFDMEFDQMLTDCIAGAELDTGSDEAKIRSAFYQGGAEGYIGLRLSEKGAWVRAYFNATKSVDIYQELLLIKPNIKDSYLALGQYRYYKSLKRNEYWFLAFMKDETELALSEIEITAKHGIYANLESITALLHIYMEKGSMDKAEEQLNKLLPKYANNVYFKEQKALIHLKKKEWSEAITGFQEVLNHQQSDSFKNNQDLYAKYYLSKAYFYKGEQEKAEDFIKKASSDPRLTKNDFLKGLKLQVEEFAKHLIQNRKTILKTRET